jgi:hypothetical protein
MPKCDEEIKLWSQRTWQALDFSAGSALSHSEVEKLEAMIALDSSDATARILLLGRYNREALKPGDRMYARYLTHFIWLIENQPWHVELSEACNLLMHLNGIKPGNVEGWIFDQGKADLEKIEALWKSALQQHSNNNAVIINAAYAFLYSSPAEADACIAAATANDPNDRRLLHVKRLQDIRTNHC